MNLNTLGSFLWGRLGSIYWAAVKDLKLSYYNKESLLFTFYPYYGDFV